MKGIVGAGALLATATAGNLKLTWNDCGDSSTKAKITSFAPGDLTLGQTTTMIGTGNLVEDVAAANFDVEMNGAFHLLSCKGDASQSKTCGLPLGTGKLTFDAMAFPIKAGQTQVKVDLTLSGALPRALLKTTTKATATASNGDKLFCLEIGSAPEESSPVSKSDLASSAAPDSLNAVPVIENLVCEVAEQKWIEEKATDEICSAITKTFPVPDCQANLEKIWDKVTSMCPQGRETIVARSAHVESIPECDGGQGIVKFFQLNADVSKCMDIAGGQVAIGAGVQISTCNGQDSQKFIWCSDGRIVSRINDNMCLDIPGGDPSVTSYLQMYPCNGAAGQYWGYDYNAMAISPTQGWQFDNMCMDVDSSSGKLVNYWCSPGGSWQAQKWQVNDAVAEAHISV